MTLPKRHVEHVAGAEGLSVLWFVSSSLLPSRPLTAMSTLSERSYLALEMLLLCRGFKAEASSHEGGLTFTQRLATTIRIVLAAQAALLLSIALQLPTVWKEGDWIRLLGCFFAVRTWSNPDPDCPVENLWIVMGIVPSLMLHALGTHHVLARVAHGSKGIDHLKLFGCAIWIVALVPSFSLTLLNGGFWLSHSQALATWHWPPALAADFLLGATMAAITRAAPSTQLAGTFADASIILGILASWLFPLSNLELQAGFAVNNATIIPLINRLAAPMLALSLYSEARVSSVAAFLSHRAIAGLGGCALEVLILCSPFRDFCKLTGILELESAPGYIAFLLLLWLLAELLSIATSTLIPDT